MSLRTTISQAKTRLYRKPKDELERFFRWGPNAYYNIDKWKGEMEKAADELPAQPALNTENKPELELWFLTGVRFWYQTAFCLTSLSQHSQFFIKPVILNDGTLQEREKAKLSRLFPSAIFRDIAECDAQFYDFFSEEKFPHIHYWRSKQLLFRKLTDVHGGADETRIFFDSDMLFFQHPTQFEQWFTRRESTNIVQRDCWESYGYSRELTKKLCGKDMPESANIGVFSLNGSKIDWEEVDYWIGQLKEQEGPKYNITQCTVSMIMTQSDLEFLDTQRYQVYPKVSQQDEELVMGHYVSDSKPWYFSKAWRLAI